MIRILPFLLLLLGAASCGAPAAGPAETARAFWEASRAGDDEQVRRLVSSETRTGTTAGGAAQFTGLEVGETRVAEEGAVVETHLTIQNDAGDSLRITFPTHLVREGRTWKVALDETLGAAMWAVHAEGMRGRSPHGDSTKLPDGHP